MVTCNFPEQGRIFFSLSYKWKYITDSLLTALRASGQMKPEILNLFSKICQKVDAQFSSLYTTGRPSLNQLRRPPSMWTIVLYPSNDSRYAAINDLLPTPLIQSNHRPSSGMQTFTGLNWTKWVMWKPHLDCWPSERLAVGFTVPPDWQATIVLVLLSSLEFTSVKRKTHQMSEDTLLCYIPLLCQPGWDYYVAWLLLPQILVTSHEASTFTSIQTQCLCVQHCMQSLLKSSLEPSTLHMTFP